MMEIKVYSKPNYGSLTLVATKKRIDLEQAKDNIRQLWAMRTHTAKKVGLRWYVEAHNDCGVMSEVLNIPFENCVALVSALSPQTDWTRNISLAYDAFEEHNLTGNVTVHMYPTCNSKARDILDGNFDANNIDATFSLKTGAKTYHFYHNILNPNDHRFVTIDSHATAIAYGLFNVTGTWRLNKAAYLKLAQAYFEVAAEFDILPCEFQAVCWTTRKQQLDTMPSISLPEFVKVNFRKSWLVW